MAVLTSRARKAIPTSEFALAGRKYPIEDEAHARNALARSARYATPEEHAQIVAKVRKRYPRMRIESGIAR